MSHTALSRAMTLATADLSRRPRVKRVFKQHPPVGSVFNHWTIKAAPYSKQTQAQKRVVVACQCKCGTESELILYDVVRGKHKMCRKCKTERSRRNEA